MGQIPSHCQGCHRLSSGGDPKTVLTLINRLVEKGAVDFETGAGTHRYFPKVTEHECRRVKSRSFLERVYGGSLQPMLAHFISETPMSEADIKQLRKILDDKRANLKQASKAKP
jgi:BlaI family penicillinase repressor